MRVEGDLPRVSHDWLFAGTLSIRQPARRAGYRVNVDAILLAAFAARALAGGEPRSARGLRARHAVDLGAGVGAVGLTLLHFEAAARVTMVEIDPTLARLAAENAAENAWGAQAEVVQADVRDAAKGLHADADLVACNPPYVPPGRGRAPAERVRSAKYGDLATFVEAARQVAGRRARACFVYPAIEATTLLTTLRAHGLEPKRLRAVHGRADDKARVVLVESVPGKPGGLAIEPPFVETDGGGARSTALAALLTTRRR
ncbi:MAG: methyltransferase [Labilithrix sp.]|nr:methyltransferase [Labilithrix sp.]